MEKVITYSLMGNSDNSDKFYSDLSSFTDDILRDANAQLSVYVDGYITFVTKTGIEAVRSKDEYMLEMIMIGVFWRNYMYNAYKTKFISKALLNRLYEIRNLNPSVKPTVDLVRGALAYELLNHNIEDQIDRYTLHSFTNLVGWLSATGEFSEEVIRLNPWADYFKSTTFDRTAAMLKSTVEFSSHFQVEGKKALGQYLSNVNEFQASHLNEFAYREDYFFAARKENEYLLNMIGAEILNRNMRTRFDQMPNKVLLLPTCMQNEPYDGCKAIDDGKELVCQSCFSKCNIGRVAKEMNKLDVNTYLIPHSSDFSRFLVKWKDSQDTALIGVACVLNLLKGGYEMKRMNIASQCVFLDYCGCKNHWDKDGFATDLNINRLLQVVKEPAWA